jgi:hypothetical protein
VIQAIKRIKKSLVLILAGGTPIGTGFFVAPGKILTCAHTSRGSELTVSTCYGSIETATISRFSGDLDLALLDTKEAGEPVELTPRHRRNGSEVGFMGCPFPRLLAPPLVMTHRSIIGNRYELGGVEHYVIDSVVGEGYSGSPLFLSADGSVCGMISSRFDPLRLDSEWRGAPVSSLTFALTSKLILDWLNAE